MPRGREQTGAKAAADEGAEAAARVTDAVSAGGAPGMIDLEFVKALIEAVDGSGIDSLEVTRAGSRVRISKTPPNAAGSGYYGPPIQHANPSSPGQVMSGASGGAAPPAPSESAPAAEPTPAAPASNLVDVTSPMVGTFYRAPAPEAPPYVEVGSRVTKGQTLCILEAMKLMNELESEVEGTIREVLVDNADPVEYGQVLFRLEPSG